MSNHPEDDYELPDDDTNLLDECYVYTFRAGGKGGQHVNKTDSAVRLVHKPTGLTATCSKERSQYLNKKQCLENLRKKIIKLTDKLPPRIPTSIPHAAKRKRRNAKSVIAKKKKLRSSGDFFE
jgi:protein subunit release factor B